MYDLLVLLEVSATVVEVLVFLELLRCFWMDLGLDKIFYVFYSVHFSYFFVLLLLLLSALIKSLSLEDEFSWFLVSLGESNLLSNEFLFLCLLLYLESVAVKLMF